jgi:NitT/TauT family transport system ATP-binding protein
MTALQMPAASAAGVGGAGIDVRDVTKFFTTGGSDLHVLDNVSLTVEPGAFLSILGPSGCGKSTLLAMMAGLIGPTGGALVVDGVEIRRPYDGLGMVFQRDALLPWRSVIDNVMVQVELMGVPRRKRGPYLDRARELLAMVHLSDFEHSYPRQLSGGMRQRVALCRALVHSPRMLLMDEPFGALDALTREQLNIDLEHICRPTGVTSVLVTHSIDEAVFLGDEVAVFAPRPTRVLKRFPVELARPRSLETKDTPAFVETASALRECLKGEGILEDE